MKWALVTGGAGGMGYAAARRLIREGWGVFALDRNAPAPCEGLVYLPADLTDEDSVQAAFDAIRARTDRLDCIVHMAGVYDLGSLVELSDEEIKRVFEVNFFAVCRVDRVFLPLLKAGSRILITTSELAVLDPLPFTGLYAVSKAALDKYAYSLRMEVQMLGISVIVLRPGAVQTGMLDASTRALSDFCETTTHYRANSERFRRIVGRVEARTVPPERIAALAWKALSARRPRYVYTINRNPLLLLMDRLPDRWQTGIIRRVLGD